MFILKHKWHPEHRKCLFENIDDILSIFILLPHTPPLCIMHCPSATLITFVTPSRTLMDLLPHYATTFYFTNSLPLLLSPTSLPPLTPQTLIASPDVILPFFSTPVRPLPTLSLSQHTLLTWPLPRFAPCFSESILSTLKTYLTRSY
jgi:hypothetical protein